MSIAMTQPLLEKFIGQAQVKYDQGSCLITAFFGGAYGHFEIAPGFLELLNHTVAELYVRAIRGSAGDEDLSIKHIVMKVGRDCPLKLLYPEAKARDWHYKRKEAWFRQNAYCILIKKEADDQTKYSLMLEHLNKYFGETFGITGSYEVKAIRCLVLVKDAAMDGPQQNEMEQPADSPAISVKDLVRGVNNSANNYLGYPIVDESGHEGLINISMPSELFGPEALNQELKKYCLKLVDVVRPMGMVVIKSAAYK